MLLSLCMATMSACTESKETGTSASGDNNGNNNGNDKGTVGDTNNEPVAVDTREEHVGDIVYNVPSYIQPDNAGMHEGKYHDIVATIWRGRGDFPDKKLPDTSETIVAFLRANHMENIPGSEIKVLFSDFVTNQKGLTMYKYEAEQVYSGGTLYYCFYFYTDDDFYGYVTYYYFLGDKANSDQLLAQMVGDTLHIEDSN